MTDNLTISKKNSRKQAIKKTKNLKVSNCYSYDPKLKEYLDAGVELLKMKEKPEFKRTNKYIERNAKNRNDKVDVLNKIVFPSMGNLIYLFEYMQEHPELIGVLDNDIDELLGLKGQHWKVRGKAEERKKYSTFQRLMYALLSYPNRNTKLALQNIAGYELITHLVISGAEKEPLIGNKLITQDLGRALVWMQHITSGISLNINQAHRPITF